MHTPPWCSTFEPPQEMELYRYSAAFPELVIPVLGHIKKFAKLTKVKKNQNKQQGRSEFDLPCVKDVMRPPPMFCASKS